MAATGEVGTLHYNSPNTNEIHFEPVPRLSPDS